MKKKVIFDPVIEAPVPLTTNPSMKMKASTALDLYMNLATKLNESLVEAGVHPKCVAKLMPQKCTTEVWKKVRESEVEDKPERKKPVRLTKQQRDAVRRDCKKLSQTKVAKMYNVSDATVSAICKELM